MAKLDEFGRFLVNFVPIFVFFVDKIAPFLRKNQKIACKNEILAVVFRAKCPNLCSPRPLSLFFTPCSLFKLFHPLVEALDRRIAEADEFGAGLVDGQFLVEVRLRIEFVGIANQLLFEADGAHIAVRQR